MWLQKTNKTEAAVLWPLPPLSNAASVLLQVHRSQQPSTLLLCCSSSRSRTKRYPNCHVSLRASLTHSLTSLDLCHEAAAVSAGGHPQERRQHRPRASIGTAITRLLIIHGCVFMSRQETSLVMLSCCVFQALFADCQAHIWAVEGRK